MEVLKMVEMHYEAGKKHGQQVWESEPRITMDEARAYSDGVLDQIEECIEGEEESDGA